MEQIMWEDKQESFTAKLQLINYLIFYKNSYKHLENLKYAAISRDFTKCYALSLRVNNKQISYLLIENNYEEAIKVLEQLQFDGVTRS